MKKDKVVISCEKCLHNRVCGIRKSIWLLIAPEPMIEYKEGPSNFPIEKLDVLNQLAKCCSEFLSKI